MSTSPDPNQSAKTYVFDAESSAEMARLLDQDKLMTEALGGLFPDQLDLSKIHRVLDIASGPGGWVHEVAQAHTDMAVTGIDISHSMVEYAQAHARVRRLQNAHFRQMDALQRLDFPDATFDLVNARTILAFMPKVAWPRLIQECLRVLKPGGVLRLTEAEWGFTNTPAFERYCDFSHQLLKLAEMNFSPAGLNGGITPMMGRFLKDAGFNRIQKKAYVIDFSAGEEAHSGFYQDYVILLKLGQPILIKLGITTQEEADRLYQQALDEMRSDEFCALWFLLSVWGERP